MWYQVKIRYGTLVEGRHRIVSELYLLNCVSPTDVEATAIEILSSRIKCLDFDSIARFAVSDIYKMNDGPISEVEGDFYLVKVACNFGDSKTVDKHLVNADSPKQAEKRVRERLKNVLFDYNITHCDLTKILGVYDKDNVVWVEDFKNRMDILESQGKKDVNYNQMDIDFDSPSGSTSSAEPAEPTAGLLESGTKQIGSGGTLLLNEAEETQEAEVIND